LTICKRRFILLIDNKLKLNKLIKLLVALNAMPGLRLNNVMHPWPHHGLEARSLVPLRAQEAWHE